MNDNIFVVGKNEFSELCTGDFKAISSLTPFNALNDSVEIANINNGRYYTIITSQNGDHYGIGYNSSGQLGLGHFDTTTKLTEIKYFKENNLTIKQIFTSSNSLNTLFLTMDDKLYVTGLNYYNNGGSMDDHETHINKPQLIQNIPKITSIAQGEYHNVLLDAKGSVYSTYYNGWSNDGQNGFGDVTFDTVKQYGFHPIPYFKHKTITKISAGICHALFLDDTNTLYGCGQNGNGQLGLGHTEPTKDLLPVKIDYFSKNGIVITGLSSGYYHNLVLDQKGEVHAFGSNDFGQSGVGNSDQTISTPTLITKSIEPIINIGCGNQHSYLQTTSNEYYLFGNNQYNECTLETKILYKPESTIVSAPYSINATFTRLTNHRKKIQSIHLGRNCTWIVTEDTEEKIGNIRKSLSLTHIPNKIPLSNMLVLIISVGSYDSLHDLQGTQRDKERISKLFRSEYNYKIISTPSSYVTYKEMDDALIETYKEFRDNDTYSGIMVFFSGHGSHNFLLLSDFNGKYEHSQGCYFRPDFESYFNNQRLPNKHEEYRFYFIDSCRGAQEPQLQQMEDDRNRFKFRKGSDFIHPELNRSILYSNSNMYSSYEVPFDESMDDIDRAKLTPDGVKNITDKDPKCGIFTNAVYAAFRDNAKNGFNGNYASIVDDIMRKNREPIPVLGNFENKIGQQATHSCPFYIYDQLALTFERNKEVKYEEEKKDNVVSNIKEEQKETKVLSPSDPDGLLRSWGLGQYVDLLIIDEGWDDTDDWKDIELDYLQEIGFKTGHARKFMRLSSKLFQQ